MTEEWISLREFARRREVSLAAVQKAIASGRVTTIKRDGDRITGIEFHAAMAQWNGNTDIDQAQRAGAPILVQPNTSPATGGDLLAAADQGSAARQVADPGSGAAAAATPGAGATGDDQRYLAARAIKQEFEAKNAELQFLEKCGVLVPADELRRISGQRYRGIRDKLLNIADRISTVVAAERDPARVHAAITAEIKRVLNELADDAAAEAARGPAERVAA